MIGVVVKLTSTIGKVIEAKDEAAFKNLRHAGASIRKDAQRSMVRAKGPSRPGTPPHRHRGRLAKSILYDVAKDEVLIGPSYARMKAGDYPPWMASMHERGGTFGGNDPKRKKRKTTRKASVYPARPFMRPALERAAKRIANDWRSTIS